MEKKVLYVLEGICKISGDNPCKKKVQKIIYLIENSKAALGFKYGIHLYGPYSAALNDSIMMLNLLNDIDIYYDNMSHKIKINHGAVGADIAPENKKAINKVIERYGKRTPYELELLTTTLYVMQNVSANQDEIVSKVREIKGTKYSLEEICGSIRTLKSDALIKLNRSICS